MNNTNIVNLTPHSINLYDGAGALLHSIPPSGDVARVAQRRTNLSSVAGVPVTRSEFGNVTGLPRPKEGTIYIVSGLVLSRTTRSDVFAPGKAIRDSDGRVIGCEGLSAAPLPEDVAQKRQEIQCDWDERGSDQVMSDQDIQAVKNGNAEVIEKWHAILFPPLEGKASPVYRGEANRNP